MQRSHAARLMAEVLADAPANDFSSEEVTQGADVPDEVRPLVAELAATARPSEDDADELVDKLKMVVETSDAIEVGQGAESVYAYGYRCAPDRLKIGSCTGDVNTRIA